MINEILKFACLLFAPFAVGACAGLQDPVEASRVIGDVTVIDPETRTVRDHRTVFISNGRIVAVRPFRKEHAETARDYVDGNGKYLLPGLMDMHVHVAHPMFSDTTLALLLANGVTGVREMSGDCWEPRGEIFACIDDYRKLQQAIEAGEIAGPRLLRISSAIVRGPQSRRPPHVPEGAKAFVTPADEAQARTLVRYLDERGVDLIKTYDGIPRAAYLALLDEARRRDMEVSGHVPVVVDVTEAAALGHRTLEHARAPVYDCSDYGPRLHRMMNDLHGGKEGAPWPSPLERARESVTRFNVARCQGVMDALAASGAWYVPTHETREMDAMASDAAYRDDPRLRFIAPQLKGFWQRDLDSTASQGAAAAKTFQRFHELGLAVTRLAHERGVRIMAGTDANDTMSFPGFSLHDELAHLSRAGLPAMEVLRAATTVPAEYLGMSDDLGGISAGKRADLVLLEQNPLERIENTKTVLAVFIGERIHRRSQLDDMLSDAASRGERAWWEDIEIVELPTAMLADYSGRYRVPSSGLEIEITASDGSLLAIAKGMPVTRFYPESETTFFMKEDQTRFAFARGAAGEVSGLEVIWGTGRSEFAPRID